MKILKITNKRNKKKLFLQKTNFSSHYRTSDKAMVIVIGWVGG